MKHKSIKKRRIHQDCWSLDSAFFRWLEERLPVYLKDAGEFIDLEYHKFEYKGEIYTQKELIEKMIEDLRLGHGCITFDPYEWDKYNEVLEIWALIAPAMWW